MENTYTIKELVEMHGSIQQKNHFEKYGTFKSGNMKEVLLKEAKRYYCPPYNKIHGRLILYTFGENRKSPTSKEDGRGEGNASKEYRKWMFIIVALHLKMDNLPNETLTIQDWLYEFGLISESLYKLMKGRYSDTAFIAKLIDFKASENKEEIYLLEALSGYPKEGELSAIDKRIKELNEEVDEKKLIKQLLQLFRGYNFELKSQFEKALERMEQAGIIGIKEIYYGNVNVKGNPKKNKRIILSDAISENIINRENQLLKAHEITKWHVEILANSNKTKEFKNEFNNYLLHGVIDEWGKHISVNYYYRTLVIYRLSESGDPLIEYMQDYFSKGIELLNETGENNFICDVIENYNSFRFERVSELAKRKIETDSFTQNKAREIFGDNVNWAELFLNSIKIIQSHFGKIQLEDIQTSDKTTESFSI